MIEVRCLPSGDVAFAEDPEAAVVAARTLIEEDDRLAMPVQGRERWVTFFVDGKVARGPFHENEFMPMARSL